MKKRGRSFRPTPEQRHLVATLAGLKCTWEELRLLVLHQDTGLPVTKTTLHKHFKRELSEGGARVKALIGQKYVEAVQRGEAWAIRLGLRNRYGWSFEGGQPLAVPDDVAMEVRDIGVRFILPPKREEQAAAPIDVTPSPYEGQPADLSRPALPKPPQRVRTATGALWEERGKGSWMK
jgi:hypothetical protein